MALPIDDLAREAFVALSRGDLDWLQRQYLAQDIRCHFPGGAPWSGTTRAYLRRWGSLAGPSSSQAAHSVFEVRDVLANDSTPSRWPRSTADGPARRLERHDVFISHITESPTSPMQADQGLEEGMKRAARRTLVGVGLASVVTAVTVAATVAPSWATPPVGW